MGRGVEGSEGDGMTRNNRGGKSVFFLLIKLN